MTRIARADKLRKLRRRIDRDDETRRSPINTSATSSSSSSSSSMNRTTRSFAKSTDHQHNNNNNSNSNSNSNNNNNSSNSNDADNAYRSQRSRSFAGNNSEREFFCNLLLSFFYLQLDLSLICRLRWLFFTSKTKTIFSQKQSFNIIMMIKGLWRRQRTMDDICMRYWRHMQQRRSSNCFAQLAPMACHLPRLLV